jgi:hypothetical protein
MGPSSTSKSIIDLIIILVDQSGQGRPGVGISAGAYLDSGSTDWFGRRTNMGVDCVGNRGVDTIILPDGRVPSTPDFASDSTAT